MGLLEFLGLTWPASTVQPAATGPKPMTAAEGAELLNKATAYAPVLASAQSALAGLSDPKVAAASATIQSTLIDPARADAKAGNYDAAMARLGEVAAAVQAARDYLLACTAAQQARDHLAGHPQSAHVQGEIAAANGHLRVAQGHANKSAWPAARAALLQAQTACRDGEGFARRFADTMKVSAQVAGIFVAITNSGWSGFDDAEAIKGGADAKADPPTRDYDGAIADYNHLFTLYDTAFRDGYLTPLKADIAKVEKHQGAAFIAPEIQRAKTLATQVEAAITARQWRKAILTHDQVKWTVLFQARRLAVRGVAYSKERALTVKAIDGLKAHKSLLGQVMSLNTMLGKADALASREQMQVEDGIEALRSIRGTCAELVKVAEASAAYVPERSAADQAMATLEKHAAADKVGTEIEAIRKLLARAGKLAGDMADSGARGIVQSDAGSQDFDAARAVLRQASSDIAAARQVADGLLGVASVERLAGATPDKRGATQAAAADGDLAHMRQARHAELIAQDLLPVDAGLAQARQLIAAGQPEAATQQLVLAGQALADARRKQVEFARNAQLREALNKRVAALRLLPEAAEIGPRIDDIAQRSDESAALDRDGQWSASMVALRRGEVAAALADETAQASKTCQEQADAVAALAAEPTNAAIKDELERAVASAKTAAARFDYAVAAKALTTAENRARSAAVEATTAGAAPDLERIEEEAGELMQRGGEKELDALIARLPATVKAEVLQALAKARFGVEFQAEKDGNEQASIQRMCALMGKVPADVMKNPSLKRITRRVTTQDATGATVSQDFPFYQASDNEVVMNARPGESEKPDFMPIAQKPQGLSPEDDAIWEQWLEDNRRLPKDVETACQPANNKGEDLFDFNMLHELAHAIDDANNFMVARENQSTFGGWITHGGDVDTIAAAVAEAKKFDQTTEQIAYVAALVSRSQAIVPDRPDKGGDEFDRAKAAVDAWYADAVTDNVWDSDAASARLVIGDRIYHQAYPDTWVSYLATARKRGITSYQFRAPGEWFSELYAAFKSGKLKPEHPSRAWLAKLSI